MQPQRNAHFGRRNLFSLSFLKRKGSVITYFSLATFHLLSFFILIHTYLFLEREENRGREREVLMREKLRNINTDQLHPGLAASCMASPGTEPATQARAQTWNRTCNRSVHRLTLNSWGTPPGPYCLS